MAGIRNPDDPRNKLYKYTIKVIQKVKLKYFVLENVKESELFNHIFSKHSNEMIAKIQNTPQGKSMMKKYSNAYFRLDYDKPSRTVKENHGRVHVHPKIK